MSSARPSRQPAGTSSVRHPPTLTMDSFFPSLSSSSTSSAAAAAAASTTTTTSSTKPPSPPPPPHQSISINKNHATPPSSVTPSSDKSSHTIALQSSTPEISSLENGHPSKPSLISLDLAMDGLSLMKGAIASASSSSVPASSSLSSSSSNAKHPHSNPPLHRPRQPSAQHHHQQITSHEHRTSSGLGNVVYNHQKPYLSRSHQQQHASSLRTATSHTGQQQHSYPIIPQSFDPKDCHPDYPGLDPFLLQTARHPKDRPFLLKLDEEFEKFFNAIPAPGQTARLEYPGMNSYQRLIIHRLGQHYQFAHIYESARTAVILFVSPKSAIPAIRFRDIPVDENLVAELEIQQPQQQHYAPPSYHTNHSSFRIMSRNGGGGGHNGSYSSRGNNNKYSDSKGATAHSASSLNVKSIEEREAEYALARAEIFDGASDVSESQRSDRSYATSTAGSPSSASANMGTPSSASHARHQKSGGRSSYSNSRGSGGEHYQKNHPRQQHPHQYYYGGGAASSLYRQPMNASTNPYGMGYGYYLMTGSEMAWNSYGMMVHPSVAPMASTNSSVSYTVSPAPLDSGANSRSSSPTSVVDPNPSVDTSLAANGALNAMATPFDYFGAAGPEYPSAGAMPSYYGSMMDYDSFPSASYASGPPHSQKFDHQHTHPQSHYYPASVMMYGGVPSGVVIPPQAYGGIPSLPSADGTDSNGILPNEVLFPPDGSSSPSLPSGSIRFGQLEATDEGDGVVEETSLN